MIKVGYIIIAINHPMQNFPEIENSVVSKIFTDSLLLYQRTMSEKTIKLTVLIF